jgi:aminocarboxymuconate-semialdehyde decarboxylase
VTIVDHQVHWFPRAFVDSLVGRSEYPIVERVDGGGYRLLLDEGADQPQMEWLVRDVEEHLAQASAHGVDVLVIGPATLGEVLHLPAGEAGELLNGLHEHYAQAQRDHPDRVACLAGLPLQSAEESIQVLDRAIGELDLRGVAIVTSNEGRSIAEESLWPVYERIAELGVPIFLHPGYRSITRAYLGTRRDISLGWVFQTSVAAMQLVDSGLLDAFPDLVVVHPHLGGVLPYVAGRVRIETSMKSRFYGDTAIHTPQALSLGCDIYGVDRVVFASDHPFGLFAARRRFVEATAGPALAEKIYANRLPGLQLGPTKRA